jgi:hypothetical protein
VAPTRVAPAAPADLVETAMVEFLVGLAVGAVVLGPIVLGALGGLTGLWIGRRFVPHHHTTSHDHEVDD